MPQKRETSNLTKIIAFPFFQDGLFLRFNSNHPPKLGSFQRYPLGLKAIPET